jgi:hypothetical protein
VVLDYGDNKGYTYPQDYTSADGKITHAKGYTISMADWIKETFPEELASHRLKYARYESEDFKMAHAKNMAHRLASGDVLCNVDADNFIVKDFSRWLERKFQERPDRIISTHIVNIAPNLGGIVDSRIAKGNPEGRGGRIAISRENFYKFGGYSEAINGWGPDDVDFVVRGREGRLDCLHLPKEQWGSVIGHDNAERLANLSVSDRQASTELLARPTWRGLSEGLELIKKTPSPRANVDGNVGVGSVCINFDSQPTQISPVEFGEPPRPRRRSGAQI